MKILVTGGAGYIGTHTLIELIASGHDPVVVDNLSNSSAESLNRVREITKNDVPFYEIDLIDIASLRKIFADHSFDAVIHFAGLKAVGESVTKPTLYYKNNIDSTLSLIDAMNEYGVHKLIFSSSATVYGEPTELPLTENSTVGVGLTNPYGKTKYMIEEILKDLSASNDSWEITILRYFNPVGAHKSGLIGEDPKGIPNNLLPFVAQVAVGKRPYVQVFGDDYDTPDGTGVRDYIHVVDLADGHVKALEGMKSGVNIYNLGTGKGVSVLELINAFSKACGKDVAYKIVDRRPGDIAACYASPDKANEELGWTATKTIDQACADAWKWQSQNPDGFNK